MSSTGPLLVLGAGQRCGSTLLQRLLCSHPDVMIWGEHAGQLRPFIASNTRTRIWSDQDGQRGRMEFEEGGYQSFIANVMPGPDQIDDAARSYIRSLFADPAADLGRTRWGFKEVRYGLPEVVAIRRWFPELRVLHILRDPRDVLRSLDVWERADGEWRRRDTEAAIADWTRIAYSFLGTDVDSDIVLNIRYEDLIDDPGHWTTLIAKHCGLDSAQLDDQVFARKIHTDGPNREAPRRIKNWSELAIDLQALARTDDVLAIATSYGYDF